MITAVEELSLNAWPSLQTIVYDGWVIRFANGYTRRANSVNPLYPSAIDIDEKIRFCESIYQDKKMDVVFKITPASHPHDLDQKLATIGYRRDFPTSVQVLKLKTANLQLADQVIFQEELPDEWLNSYCRMSAVTSLQRETLCGILLNIIPRHCFVSIKSEDKIVACGMGVIQNGYIGLFDIVTDSAFRNAGYGQQLVESILAWGRQNGAQTAYLQVMLNNSPALRLYSKIGFAEKYQYWYRIKP